MKEKDFRSHEAINNRPRHKACPTSRKKKHKVGRRQRTAVFNYKDVEVDPSYKTVKSGQ